VPEVVGRAGYPGQDEEIAAADRADVVSEWFANQSGLHGFELASEVLLIAGEDQALVRVVPGPMASSSP
jgi:hypothetical protein